MDEATRVGVLHSVQEVGPAMSIVAVQALLGGQLQHAQAERKNVDAARVLVLQVIFREHRCT